jgi:hypothetical protein
MRFAAEVVMRIVDVAACIALAACSSVEMPPTTSEPGSSPAYRADAGPADLACTGDRDCVLLPYVTCCGECPPAPPFEAGSIHDLDAILIESEQICAERRVSCLDVTLACDVVPRGCEARPACVAGRCVVVEVGCGPPTS